MKKEILFMIMVLSLLFVPLFNAAFAAGEVKEVCHDVKNKSGKMVKECKKIKVHKKLEGTKVPEGKKK